MLAGGGGTQIICSAADGGPVGAAVGGALSQHYLLPPGYEHYNARFLVSALGENVPVAGRVGVRLDAQAGLAAGIP